MKRVSRGKNKGGRPPHVPKKKYRRDIRVLASVGYDIDTIAAYLRNKYGIAISANTVAKYYRSELHNSPIELLALARKGLRAALVKGAPWAVCFTLKTRGKNLGWLERIEATGKDGAPLFDLRKLSDKELKQFHEMRKKIIDDAKAGNMDKTYDGDEEGNDE